MVRKSADKIQEVHEHKFGADGYITVRSLLNTPEEMYNKGRVFAHTTVAVGSGIGYHVHNGDSETYYVFSGEGEFNDNGTLVPVSAGDVLFTADGEGHALRNTGSEPLEIIALILYH